MGALKFGIVGIGNAGTQVEKSVPAVEGVQLTAVCDVRPDALAAYAQKHPDVRVFDSVEAMCDTDAVDAVWVASPSEWHGPNTIAAAERGKHVICEKPFAISIEEADRMIETADRGGVKLLLHSTTGNDQRVRKMREVIVSGRIGRVIQINSWQYKDWFEDPHRPSELDTSQGGGVVFRQAPHQIEPVRWIGGGMVRSVRATTGKWDPRFDTEANVTAFLEFEDGTPATIVLNCYGYFYITELARGKAVTMQDQYWWSNGRQSGPVDDASFYAARLRHEFRESVETRPTAPAERSEGAFSFGGLAGLVIVSCERGDMRHSPRGIYLYTEAGREEIECPPSPGDRAAHIQELRDAIAEDRPVFTDGRWGRATVEVVLAMLESARERREVYLSHQWPTPE